MESSNSMLNRSLGLVTVTAIVVGSVIGTGIFKKPAIMAQHLGSAELLIAVWVVAGLVTLFGALANAEVAGMISKTGGAYEFFREMYGELVAFLYGWAVFIVIQTGTIASVTYVFSEYAQYFFTLPRLSPGLEQAVVVHLPGLGTITPLANLGVKTLTVAAVLLFTFINYVGVRSGGLVQVVVTGAKVIGILLIVAAAFLLEPVQAAAGAVNVVQSTLSTPTGFALVLALTAAMSGAFWAYDGWNNVTYVAGEVQEPQRTVPRGLILGTLIIIAVYVLTNLAYLWVLSPEKMAGSQLVAADMAKAVLGVSGGGLVVVLVMLSALGTANGTILSSARVYFAMAHRGVFFRSMGSIHPRFRTPGRALILQAVWTSVLVLSGTFDTLTDMLIFVSWVFYALGAAGLFVLRRKLPDAPRPFRVPGYPWLPAVFVLFAALFVVLTLYNDITAYARGDVPIVNSAFGLVLVAAGLPFYFWFRRKGSTEAK